jgi:hypothetical protein
MRGESKWPVSPGWYLTAPTSDKPVAPFVLSLIGGLLILGGSGMMIGFSGPGYYRGMMGGYYGMMNGYYGMMGGYGSGSFFVLAAIGVISGLIVTLGALMVYNEKGNASMWGALILVFSLVSLFGMGGFFLGAILGIVGGILAITWKPGR